MRIFAGYAGWGAGQLEGEIDGGDWYVVPSLPPDVFRADPTDLWREVMRRQPGELAWHVNRPGRPGAELTARWSGRFAIGASSDP